MAQNQSIRKHNCKAQMEGIGLTVIVVLILIGVFFGIKFALMKAPPAIDREFKQSQMGANFLNTLSGVSMPCGEIGSEINYTFNDLVENCVAGESECGCAELNSNTQEIFRKTIDKWVNAYVFYMTLNPPAPARPVNITKALNMSSCQRIAQAFVYPSISTSSGTVSLWLVTC